MSNKPGFFRQLKDTQNYSTKFLIVLFSPNSGVTPSINFHPLHTYYAMAAYAAMLFLPKTYKIIGLGLLLHMLTDLNDCVMTYLNCPQCLNKASARELVKWLVTA
ncbi:hypothetical protein K4H02_21000, partial [Mycobacterium tuberculosis]|nr:hypothetical protein [Mycobacterium tuberculosis]